MTHFLNWCLLHHIRSGALRLLDLQNTLLDQLSRDISENYEWSFMIQSSHDILLRWWFLIAGLLSTLLGNKCWTSCSKGVSSLGLLMSSFLLAVGTETVLRLPTDFFDTQYPQETKMGWRHCDHDSPYMARHFLFFSQVNLSACPPITLITFHWHNFEEARLDFAPVFCICYTWQPGCWLDDLLEGSCCYIILKREKSENCPPKWLKELNGRGFLTWWLSSSSCIDNLSLGYSELLTYPEAIWTLSVQSWYI